MSTDQWDMELDVLVIGSGNAGLTAALCSKEMGAGDVLVAEKDARFGGCSATSGGMIWIPCNPPSLNMGFNDTPEDAYSYLKGSVPEEQFRPDMIKAFIENGARMIRFLHDRTLVRYRPVVKYPDYYTDVEGAKPGYRGMEPLPINADELGKDYENLKEGHDFFNLGGVISVDMIEAHDILGAAKGWQMQLAKLFTKYILDIPWRLRSRYARRLTVGRAGIARLFLSLRQRKVPVWLNSPMEKLIDQNGEVRGAIINHDGKSLRVRARKAVVIAAGGFEHNQEMREKYLPKPTNRWWSASSAYGNTGDGIREGMRMGAKTDLLNKGWWCTTTSVPGEKVPRLSIQDKSWPGTILVNIKGQRMVNESENYMALQDNLYDFHSEEVPCSPSFQVFDADFRRKYLVPPLMNSSIRPDWTFPKRWYKEGWLAKADTLEELAEKIGVDKDGLVETVKRFNGFAATGKDLDFKRGDAAYDRYYADPTVKPNPCLAPIAKAPFYAFRIDPGDIGTQGGLVINTNGQVLDLVGNPIKGLYAAANSTSAIMPTYPGPGGTIGPGMVFAYQAAKHITGYNET